MEKKLNPKVESLISDFKKAARRLEEASELKPIQIHKDGTIQRFEFTFELAWKLLQALNEYQGVLCNSPRNCIREAARLGIINNPEEWLDFLEARNFASHIYDEELANVIYEKAKEFVGYANDLLEKVSQFTI